MKRAISRLCGILCGSLLLATTGHGAPLEPFTTDKEAALREAQRQDKLVLLIATREDCVNCQLVREFSLQTTNPPCRQMVEEVFIYWNCPTDQGCTNFAPYVSDVPDGFPLPVICVMDPATPATQDTYLARLFGAYTGSGLLTFFRRVALATELPRVTNLASNGTINSRDFTVRGTMKWTNVPTARVWFQLNGGAWSNAPSGIDWAVPLAPYPALAQKPSLNTLRVYLSDQDRYCSRTNTLNFFYDPNAPAEVKPATISLTVTNGVARVGMSNLTLGLATRLERSLDLGQPGGWTVVTSFVSQAEATSYSESLSSAWRQVFYRISTQP